MTREHTGANEIIEEARKAYAVFGIDLAEAATYGVYMRLRCARCGTTVGSIGDRVLPGMIPVLLDDNFDLYAAGLLGCKCGYQVERAREIDPARAEKVGADI
ncbi:MAG TPA: hypothetical protein VMD75_10105 [Candidatus Binataceae bacterium]|nr:hypothetical protein [Candidatus Binataceae bacterium]